MAAVRCLVVERHYPGNGLWQVQLRQVATSGIASLVRALQRPDEPTPPHTVCTAVGIVPPTVALVAAGGTYLFPRFPAGPCGLVQAAALTALQRLPWRTVAHRRIAQDQTQPELAGGCVPEWKNELLIYSRILSRASGGATVLTHDPHALLRACLYRTAGDRFAGQFSRAIAFNAADSARLRAALSGPGPTRQCAAQSEFAVIGTRAGDDVTVEIGGCWRVRRDSTPIAIGTANPAVLRPLLHS